METIYWTSFRTRWGEMYVSASKHGLLKTTLPGGKTRSFFEWFRTLGPVVLAKKETPVLKRAKKQLLEYFAGRRRSFNLPLDLRGTAFQKKVWRAMVGIPYGKIRSYQDMARAAGSPRAARAVGMANHHNPLPLIVPCHRVIGKDGSLVGFGGGLGLKRKLLTHEGCA